MTLGVSSSSHLFPRQRSLELKSLCGNTLTRNLFESVNLAALVINFSQISAFSFYLITQIMIFFAEKVSNFKTLAKMF